MLPSDSLVLIVSHASIPTWSSGRAYNFMFLGEPADTALRISYTTVCYRKPSKIGLSREYRADFRDMETRLGLQSCQHSPPLVQEVERLSSTSDLSTEMIRRIKASYQCSKRVNNKHTRMNRSLD